MLIESSSIPKYRDLSQPGDDVFAVVPQRLYAVFDGATDTVGAMVHGETPGRFAASRAALAMIECATGPQRGQLTASQWLTAMNRSIADGLKEAGAQSIRAGTTAAVVVDAGDTFRFLIVGDSAIRINGTELFRLTKDIDLLYAAGRIALFHHLLNDGMRGDSVETVARQLIFKGLGQTGQTFLSPRDVARVVETAREQCLHRLMPDALDLVEPSLLAGIAGGQYRFCNLTGHSLGYAVINGGHTQGPDVQVFHLPKSDVHSIELFTDGYMSCPTGTRVRDWEDEFFRVESEDFSKLHAHPGVKGSSSQFFSDDRTVLIIHPFSVA